MRAHGTAGFPSPEAAPPARASRARALASTRTPRRSRSHGRPASNTSQARDERRHVAMSSPGATLARILLPAAIALLAAACGGSGSAQSASSIYVQSLAYAECMHAHGAPEFPGPELGPGGSLVHPLAPPHGMLSSPGYDKAFRACEQQAPGSGGLTGRSKALVDQALSVAECMRAHGIARLPRPRADRRRHSRPRSVDDRGGHAHTPVPGGGRSLPGRRLVAGGVVVARRVAQHRVLNRFQTSDKECTS